MGEMCGIIFHVVGLGYQKLPHSTTLWELIGHVEGRRCDLGVISKSREGPDMYPVRNLSWGGDCIIRNVCVGPKNRNQGAQP